MCACLAPLKQWVSKDSRLGAHARGMAQSIEVNPNLRNCGS